MNTVVLGGRLAAPPRTRSLPSGALVAQLELTTPLAEGGRTSVPVVVPAPGLSVVALEAGAELVVLGSVRRRFFRASGGTASRTEVVASSVLAAARTRQVRAALERAARSITPTYG